MRKFFLIICIALLLAHLPVEGVADERLFDLRKVDVGNITDGGTKEFEIELKNITGSPLNIENVDTSCGCTIANAPEGPIAPGETAKVRVTIDTRGKMGDISKELKLFTSESGTPHVLKLTGKVEHFGDAMPDPSVIFKGDCASCHVGENIEKKQGQVLYNSVCFICHKNGLGKNTLSSDDLNGIIAKGIPGTSMPGFSIEAGGPLSALQVGSLSVYVRKNFYSEK